MSVGKKLNGCKIIYKLAFIGLALIDNGKFWKREVFNEHKYK